MTFSSDPSQAIIDADPSVGNSTSELFSIKSALTLHRGIVIETLCDPSLRTDELPETLINDLNRSLYRIAPRNSVVCRLITDGTSSSNESDIICFPFFSSHLALPVKSGEQVWIMRERLTAEKSNVIHYWLSRVPGSIEYEDANFTSFTRNTVTLLTSSVEPGEKRSVGAPNVDSEELTALIDGEESAIEDIIKNSVEFKQNIFEPTPRITKRPGDLVLQGSNNTSIVLGSNNRGFTLGERPKEKEASSTSKVPDPKAGTIDLVAGRGRYFETDEDEIKKSRKKKEAIENENSTKPFVIKSSLGFETDKNPQESQDRDAESDDTVEGHSPPDLGNLKSNPSEGDPDFIVDASRIYISEKTDIDNRMGLDKIVAKGFAADYKPVEASPCVAVKSDHVRIVARHLPNKAYDSEILPPKFKDAAGTIRIIKEGDPDKDLACIYIESDGTVQISGSKIFLGRNTTDGGRGQGPADGESQPYVRYSDLEKLWQDTMGALDEFCQTLSTHVTPGYGAPSPQISQAASALKGKVATLKTQIEEVKSERIFGE